LQQAPGQWQQKQLPSPSLMHPDRKQEPPQSGPE